ncbi:hypothetical protein GPECTOR_18g175 [Gonium pectorale]|uniref:Protein kinase domain-containing protein n=1 Tax=Gonium pectorale TaxID=33097 RepID=A0A150GJN9_GONPE|nr:hypothetical protein GPECTOR_18g175 [Gonium pectorale]|eukprot:KXZ50022.1 hypothetical protein GPECTOR_18g175 [Gonium pectorale]
MLGEPELLGLLQHGWESASSLAMASEADLCEAGLLPDHAYTLVRAFSGPELDPVRLYEKPSTLAHEAAWHRYAFLPDPSSATDKAAFFGFRPWAAPPASIPPVLVSPVFAHILEAVAAPAEPPTDLGSSAAVGLYQAVRELLALGSGLYDGKARLQYEFLRWHNEHLQAGVLAETIASCSYSRATLLDSPPASVVHSVRFHNHSFAVALLVCKSDVGAGDALVQAARRYQQHYQDGACWASASMYRAGPLPALVLLLEGPRLSIHAVWTIYQNRVAYAPLTPSYYLANDFHDTANLWKLMAVLAAYKKAAQELSSAHAAMCKLDASELDRMARLRAAAHAEEGQGGGGGGGGVAAAQPCTLPYSLLDDSLGLSDISFRGRGLLYAARQRLVEGGQARRVLVKFVGGRYGAEVHRAWHAAGVAPALYDVRSVGGSAYTMVVMELLRPEDGWVPLCQALQDGGGEPLKAAVREALRRAQAGALETLGHKAVHGDVRRPNILVRGAGSDAASAEVRFVDFDWAGPDGEARYPQVVLSPTVRWHDEVRPGGVMRQEHDTYLLERELKLPY